MSDPLGDDRVARELRDANGLILELESIFASSYDEIFVTDGQGLTIRVNPACERLYGVQASALVGRHVDELESLGFFSPSVTLMALKEKARVTAVQDTKSGRKIIATANPVFDREGRIKLVITNSRDITELLNLREQLEEAQKLVKRYHAELTEYRQQGVLIDGMVVQSPQMQRVLEMARRVAGVDSTVLLTGESGVGKDRVAQFIHQASRRAEGPFIRINCGAIPETLLESELFGYKAGAFTGARREGKLGMIELAQGGTLFLDEVGELPLSLQVKLLHVLQEKQFQPLGSTKPLNADVRVVAATNRDLQKMVEEGSFREDLFWRLQVVPIHIPPLRERREDLSLLVMHFLEVFSRKYAMTRTITSEAMDRLCTYHWPGNVRELENLVERLVVTAEGSAITAADLPDSVRWGSDNRGPRRGRNALKGVLESLEKRILEETYQSSGSTHKAARLLGMSQSTIVRKLRKHKIKPIGSAEKW